MKIHHLQLQNSILNTFVSEIREVQIQKDSLRFRRNIERIGEIMAYEISRTLPFKMVEITTPLGVKNTTILENQPVICSILRAGLPLHTGFLNYFDKAENTFVSAYRLHTTATDFDIKVEYFSSSNLDDKVVILADPMLATGKSLIAVINLILSKYKPAKFIIAAVIASTEGIAFVKKNLPPNATIFVADIDDKLNEKGYIIPGLGDAGDLAFGTKL